jgi:hypothetical protein
MYYRVAIQTGQSPAWRWKSTVLSSLDTLFRFLQLYRALPPEHLRVFSSSSREEMNEQLAQENKDLGSTSVTAAQFLHERMLCSREGAWGALEQGAPGNQETASNTVATKPSLHESSRGAHVLDERGMSSLERRRLEVERGAGGDHDLPYTFALPHALPQVRAWVKLLVKVQHGALQP